MHVLEPQALIRCLQQHTTRKDWWVAYSGGMDSQVLLHLLHAARSQLDASYRCAALHIHHGLHPEADHWAAHCAAVCRDLAIPLQILKVNARPNKDQSLEEAARAARMAAFKDFLGAEAALVLAHHADDQAETILWRLFRGAGPQGLGGMRTLQAWGSLELIRPFLSISKETLAHYAKSHALNWICDPSNDDIGFDRNFLRHQVIPMLVARWPKVLANINRSGALSAELALAVEAKAEQLLSGVLVSEQSATVAHPAVSVPALLRFEPAWRHAIIRAWLKRGGYAYPSYAHMQRIDAEVLGAQSGAKPRLKIGDYTLVRVGKVLKILVE